MSDLILPRTIGDTQVPKSKSRFMTGYNAGSRHEKEGIVPPDFMWEERSDDFKAGYKMGKADRRAGKLLDNETATNCINAAWHLYSNGAPSTIVAV